MALVHVPPFESFYDEHRDEVLCELRRMLGRERAEDAFQETFLRALRAYGRLRNADNLRAWVLTIARNVAVDQLRRREPRAELAGAGRPTTRPAYAELEQLTDELPPQGARGRRAPLRLRPPLRRDRRRARLVRGRRPPGGLVRSPPPAKEDA